MEKKIKILLLEDSDEDAELLRYELRKQQFSIQIVRIDTREEFISALDDFKPDVVLSDHSLPQFNSVEALRICREKNITTPFILLTGAASESLIAECFQKGADDCILKSELSKIPTAIQTALDKRDVV